MTTSHSRGSTRVRGAFALSATLFAFAMLAPRAQVQEEPDPAEIARHLSGRWSLAMSAEAAQASVDRGIAGATGSMPPIVSDIAASELRRRTPIHREIEIIASPTSIEVKYPNARTYSSQPGHPRRVPIPGEDGTMEMTQLYRRGGLEQVFSTGQGRRWNLFVPGAEGEMTLEATVNAEQLPAPLRFQLRYRKNQ